MARQRTGKSYEGQQYRGGRESGRKNLKRTDRGTLVNQHGVEFTPEEKRALENAVNRANRKRRQMLEEAAPLPRLDAGKPTGMTVGNLQAMGYESDFIMARRSKSLQRFKSREQFENYVGSLERVNDPEYIDDRTRAYKHHFLKTLEHVYGDEAKDVYMKIRMMKPEDYRRAVEQDETLSIDAVVPSDAKVPGRLNELRKALGLKQKPEWPDEVHNV